jgi:alkanesulfonate monooxygenase SsuD/methylene tetrahydromethanopterin reductase-like flavin-dependent oxidoreductase (luciferase family)
MQLATAILVPAIRHPFVAAKMLATLDVLSAGRLIVGVGPGSYQPDYDATGVPFKERWRRLDECVIAMRAIWQDDESPAAAGSYAYANINMRPRPAQPNGPPIWIGSWGSAIGPRRVARLGDGWLASAYNTTPEKFASDWRALKELLPLFGKDPATFSNGLATMFTYVTDNPPEVDRAVRQKLGPAVGRTSEELAGKLLMGSAQECARRVRAYGAAEVERIFIWPATDELRQLKVFAEQVMPLV